MRMNYFLCSFRPVFNLIRPLFLLFVLVSAVQAQQQYFLVRVFVETDQELRQLETLNVDFAYRGLKNYVDVIVTEQQLREIRSRGMFYKPLPPIQKANLFDPEYHTYEEMKAELDSLAARYPGLAMVVQIGVSQQKKYPIWAIKISDNVQKDEDEFTVNFDGMHHAREPIGMETCLLLARYLLDQYGKDPLVTRIVNETEIWITPILNVEGYKYLVDRDLSNPWWRKNLRDNNENGLFDPQVDGVDLNRNYDYYFERGGDPNFSSWTYRGPYGFSESETRAKRDLALRERFLCSITYHSYAEEIYYMRGVDGDTIPETPILDEIADSLGKMILSLDGAGHYQPGGTTSSSNQSYPWMFAVAGTYEFLIETGTEFIPPGRIAKAVAQDNLEGALYLLRKVLLGPGIVAHVRDAVTAEPVEAEVKILEFYRPGLTPRKSEQRYGRYHHFALPGTYTLRVEAPGYRPVEITGVHVGKTGWTYVDVNLEWGGSPEISGWIIDDDTTGASSGNGNQQLDLSETVELTLQLTNRGKAGFDSLICEVRSQTVRARVLQGKTIFPPAEVHETVQALRPVVIRVDGYVKDGQRLPFLAILQTLQGDRYEAEFSLEVKAPALAISKVVVHDAQGNHNGALERGESGTLEIVLRNNGRAAVHAVRSVVMDTSKFLEFSIDKDTVDVVPAGGRASFYFEASVPPGAPELYTVPITIWGTSAEQYRFSLKYFLPLLPGFFDNMELGERGWWSEVLGNPANYHNDWQWGRPSGKAGGQDPSRAYSGNYCWGNDLGGNNWNGYYQHNVDIVLHSPVIDCQHFEGVQLRFMRWLNVQAGDLAEVWVNNEVVWSNQYREVRDLEWKMQEFDVSYVADHNDSVVVSFRLKTDGFGWAGGWNIDDVLVRARKVTHTTGSPATSVPKDPVLLRVYPLPVKANLTVESHLNQAGRIQLEVYNLLGQRVASIFEGDAARGNRVFSVDPRALRLAAGIYFVVLSWQDRQTMRRYRTVQKVMILH